MRLFRSAIDLEQSHSELHDLCQPLTALQCRLELRKLPGRTESADQAIEGVLKETLRMFDAIARMRQRLLDIEVAATEAQTCATELKQDGRQHGSLNI